MIRTFEFEKTKMPNGVVIVAFGVLVRTKDLIPARYNPPSRKLGLDSLLSSVERVGLYVPVVIDTDGGVIEGHRRLDVSLEMGMPNISVIIVDGPSESLKQLYTELNYATKGHKPADRLATWILGNTTSPKKDSVVRIAAKFLEAYLGKTRKDKDEMRSLLTRYTSIAPPLVKAAHLMADCIEGNEQRVEKRRQLFLDSMHWICKHRQQRVIIEYFGERRVGKRERLLRCLERDVPLEKASASVPKGYPLPLIQEECRDGMTAKEWCVANGYPEIAARINLVEDDWKKRGVGTHRNWWDTLKKGGTVNGQKFDPVMSAP